MIKQLIILFNLISVVGFNFYIGDPVTIRVNAPSNVKPGEEFTVQLNFSLENIDGFAKLEQFIPEGLTASKEETGNATFSFKDSKLKCIWISLPEENEFSISYKIKVAETVSGPIQIDGSFSFISDNEKQSVVVPNITVLVGSDSPPVASSEKPVMKRKAPEMKDGVLCLRTISPVKGKQNEFKVEVKINAAKEGFSKIQEYIPAGFTAMELESQDGLFSFKNQVAKIIWMSLPQEPEFIVAYKLVCEDDISGNQKVNGTFSYLEGNEARKFALTPSNIFIEREEDGLATIIIDDEGGSFVEKEKPEEIIEPEKVIEHPPVEEIIAETPPPPEPEPENIATPEPPIEPESQIEDVTSIPSPESDIVYKVQIAAGHKSVEKSYFKKKYNIQEKVGIENHEGWIKYTVGSFEAYKQGRDKRNSVWNSNKINDAFVTAYNSGKRITVQEALMITNQKWYN